MCKSLFFRFSVILTTGLLAAFPALLITIIGLIPLVVINRIMNSHMGNNI